MVDFTKVRPARQRAVVPVEAGGRIEDFNVMASDADEARTVAGTLCSRMMPELAGAIRVLPAKCIVWTGDRS